VAPADPASSLPPRQTNTSSSFGFLNSLLLNQRPARRL
jgi:hypothetical protein